MNSHTVVQPETNQQVPVHKYITKNLMKINDMKTSLSRRFNDQTT